MKKIAFAALAALSLGLPAAADTLSSMLPSLSWPTETVTVSTQGCDAQAQTVCIPGK